MLFFTRTKMRVASDQTRHTDFRPSVQEVPLRRIVRKHYPLNNRSVTDFSSPITFQIDDRPPLEFIRSCELRMPLKAVFSKDLVELGLPLPVDTLVNYAGDDSRVTAVEGDVYTVARVADAAITANLIRSQLIFREPALPYQESYAKSTK